MSRPTDVARDATLTAPVVGVFVAGYVKGSPLLGWVPLDLTAVMLGMVAAAAAYEFGRVRVALRGLLAFAVMVAAFVVGAFAATGTAYADRKVLLLFGLTLPAAVCAAVVVSSEARVWWLMRWTVGAGLVVALLLYLAPSTDLAGRLGTMGSDTISVGRAAGAAAVAVVALALAGKCPTPTAVALTAPLVWVVVGSGQRGPLVAAALGVVAVLLARPGIKRVGLFVAGVAAVVLAGPWLLARTNTAAADRILLLFAEDRGESIGLREALYELTARTAWANPGGLGWGGLENLLPGQHYPHNIALEVAGEAGWVAAAAFAAVVALAFLRLLRNSDHHAAQAVLGVLVFWLTNAMFSGDVNDNRATFVLLAVALVVPLSDRVEVGPERRVGRHARHRARGGQVATHAGLRVADAVEARS